MSPNLSNAIERQYRGVAKNRNYAIPGLNPREILLHEHQEELQKPKPGVSINIHQQNLNI